MFEGMSQPPYARQPLPDESPTVRLPAPTPRHDTAPYPLDDRYDRYDRYADDRYDYRDYPDHADRAEPAEPVVDPRRAATERGPRRRGQAFALLVLLAAAAVSLVLGMLVYEALAAVDITSADPLGGLDARLPALGTALLGALAVIVLGLVALVVARPKALAMVGLLAAVLLPVGGVLVGGWFGGEVLSKRVGDSVSAAGSAVDDVVRELGDRGIDVGPLRELLPE